MSVTISMTITLNLSELDSLFPRLLCLVFHSFRSVACSSLIKPCDFSTFPSFFSILPFFPSALLLTPPFSFHSIPFLHCFSPPLHPTINAITATFFCLISQRLEATCLRFSSKTYRTKQMMDGFEK